MGTLSGIRIVEFASLGPPSFAAMLLADMGAEVIRIERPAVDSLFQRAPEFEPMLRGRRSITLDLRTTGGRTVALRLIASADVLIEGGRPGGMERLGLGPEECREANPRLVYGRLTGWGQSGIRSQTAGHDINYVSLTGVLHAIGEVDSAPVPPLALVGDLGGGALYLALGICAALVERQTSGLGDVIDAAMVDGAASLMTPFYGQLASGEWRNERGSNRLDGGAPFYGTYCCSDGKYIALGAIEEKFFQLVASELGIDSKDFGSRFDRSSWAEQGTLLAKAFGQRTRGEWTDVFAGTDACVSPVLDLDEAPLDRHLASRATFVTVGDVNVPAPAPRFERAASAMGERAGRPGKDGAGILAEVGMVSSDIAELVAQGAVVLT